MTVLLSVATTEKKLLQNRWVLLETALNVGRYSVLAWQPFRINRCFKVNFSYSDIVFTAYKTFPKLPVPFSVR